METRTLRTEAGVMLHGCRTLMALSFSGGTHSPASGSWLSVRVSVSVKHHGRKHMEKKAGQPACCIIYSGRRRGWNAEVSSCLT